MADYQNWHGASAPLSHDDTGGNLTWAFGMANAMTPDIGPGDELAANPMLSPTGSSGDAPLQQIVFIEGDVPDAQLLAAGAAPGVRAVILDPQRDGLRQIAAYLAQQHISGLAAIDLVAHGADGVVQLGSAQLSSATIGDYQSELATIGASLQSGGDIQIYGCDVAQDATGQAFLQQLSQATGGANIAASSHLVGAAAEGGNWALNVDVGTVDVSSPFTAAAMSAYPDVLSTAVDQIVFGLWNDQSGASAAGTRAEQFGVSGTSVVSGSTVDLADGSQGNASVLSGSQITGLAVDTVLNTYFLAVDDASTTTLTIQKGSFSGGGLSTLYTIPIQDLGGTTSVLGVLGGLAVDAQHGTLYYALAGEDFNGSVVAQYTGVFKLSVTGGTPTMVTSSSAGLTQPAYLALDTADNLLFFDDAILAGGTFPAVNNLDEVNLTTGSVTVLHSFTAQSSADANFILTGLDVNPSSHTLYLATADFTNAGTSNNAILSIPFSVSGSGSSASASIGSISTMYSGSGAFRPSDVVIDPAHGIFYTGGDEASGQGAVFEGSLSGGTSLTEVQASGSTFSSGASAHIGQLVLLSQPTVSTAGTVTAITGGSAVIADSSASVTDTSGQWEASATVSGVLSGDTLSYNGGAAKTFADGGTITPGFSNNTLTLTGAASAADYQSAFDAVTFSTSSETGTARTLNWTVNDGVVLSPTTTSTVQVHVHPVVTAGTTVSFTGGGSAVTLDSGLGLSASTTNLVGASVIIVGSVSGDQLNFTNQNNIAGSYASGTLTLTGTSSVGNYQAALRSITYNTNPSNTDPTGGGGHTSRTIDWSVNDGTLTASTATSTLNVVHASPTVTASGTTTFTGGGSAIVVNGSVAVSDPDSGGNLTGATIAISSNFLSGDTLGFVSQNGITGSYSNGTLTLSGTASIANYDSALGSITYAFSPGNGDPTGGGSKTSRGISWIANDGVTTASGSSTINVVHVAPAVTAGASASYPENAAPVVLDGSVTISDPDSGGKLVGATVSISNGFLNGDTLTFTPTGSITGSYTAASGLLTLSGTDTIGNYQSVLDTVSYSFSGDPTNGNKDTSRTISWTVNDGAASNSPAATSSLATLCFCAGTLIRTPGGEVRVEELAVGDTVLTARGAARPITWIGVGSVLATPGKRGDATPVIVARHALARNMPYRDLRVTKGHALFLDGALIPVEFLVNHRSICWDDRAQEVPLYHVELDAHDVLLANGAPAESYRDDGNRWLFRNANAGWDQPPLPPCAPVLTGGPLVDAAWRRLLERAGPRRMPPLTDDPDLHLLVDGARLDAVERGGAAYVFRLPARPEAVRIVSRDAIPAELGLVRDFRSLGVAIRRIVLRQGAKLRLIEAADPLLTEGFHSFEPGGAAGQRWTNGNALLPPVLLADLPAPLEIELLLGSRTQYVADASDQAAA